MGSIRPSNNCLIHFYKRTADSDLLSSRMALNPNFNQIGEAFTKQYYALFDNPATLGELAKLYNPEQSFLSFEGQQMQGTAKIMEKLQSLTFQAIAHNVTSIDCHPMFDGGILVNVMGQLKTDNDPPQSFMQNFVLKPLADSFFIQHDVFRLVLHNVGAH